MLQPFSEGISTDETYQKYAILASGTEATITKGGWLLPSMKSDLETLIRVHRKDLAGIDFKAWKQAQKRVAKQVLNLDPYTQGAIKNLLTVRYPSPGEI